jgi:glyoxylase-like metal-dependent hydrolase (beta-lactamase superfamily II)/rhodanese-related sulfurtransferase
MEVISIRTPSLGDATYIVAHGHSGIVVDPQRDLGRFLGAIDDHGLTVTHVLETHMHNDYISGGRDLAGRTGADLVLPAASGAGFAFVPAFHHEELESEGGLTIRPLHTPGHTPEHTSYLVLLDGVPMAVFTGGSLLVGAAGRSDLLGDQYAHQLAVLQWGSLQRLAELPDETGVYPTHGEGSFCTASGAGRTTSTIGLEKAENPLYHFTDADAFARNQLSGLVPYPTYYAHMGPTNKQNPTALPAASVPEVGPDAIEAHLEAGGAVVDGRDRYAFAAAHVPGSLGIELGDSFAPWSGWLLDYDSPIMLVLEHDQDADSAATELGRIGFEHVVGVMRGTDAWAGSGREVASYRTATINELMAAREDDPELQVVDVRDPLEWDAGHLDGSIHHYVPELRHGLPPVLDTSRPVWMVCRTGNRSSIAAGLAEALGVTPVVVTKGGIPDVVPHGVSG